MTQVFISYSHKDNDYARRLAAAMHDHGIDVWIDNRINYGEQWPMVIQENLENSGAIIVIMTTDASKSKWVHSEITFAEEMSKPIIPLLLEGKSLLSLSSTQYVDVRGGKLPPNDFYIRVKQALNSTKSTQPPPRIHRPRLIVFGDTPQPKTKNIIVRDADVHLKQPSAFNDKKGFPYKTISNALLLITQQEGRWQMGQYVVENKRALTGYFTLNIHLYDDLVRLAGGTPIVPKSNFKIIGQNSKPIEFIYEQGTNKARAGYRMCIHDTKQLIDATIEIIDLYNRSSLDQEDLLSEPTLL